MNAIIFDFDRIGTENDFYATAITALHLSEETFGKNLDALWDVLTGAIELPALIIFKNLTLGQLERFAAIIEVFEDAAAELGDELVFEYYLVPNAY